MKGPDYLRGSLMAIAVDFGCWKRENMPITVEGLLLVRGRPGGRIWCWLWERIGKLLARRAGFTMVKAE
jgi:hypothetical protein